jgi:hypothetical protein
MRLRWVAVLLVVGACAPASSTPAPAPARMLVGIDASELRRDLFAFAADSFRGRETGTPDEFRAARFLVNRLVSLGVEPAGDSLYYHRVPLARQVLGPNTRIAVRTGQSTVPLGLGTEVVPFTNLGPGAPLPKRNAEGDLYFAGYGLNAHGRDDFRGLNEAGKVIVMIHAAPPGITDSAVRRQLDSQDELSLRLQRALVKRPAAIVLLVSGKTTEFFQQAVPVLMRGVSPAPGDQSASDGERGLPMIVLGVARAGSPLLPATWPSDDAPQALTGRRFVAQVDLRNEPFTSYNVVGIVRGADPRLNKSYVAFGSHYDHAGIQPGMAPDSIANGADDDGSGSVAMLALAKSFRANPPRRSVLLVWHSAEEKGLLGSARYAANPTVPIDSIVAMLNMDMIGRRGGPTSDFNSVTQGQEAANRVYVVGPAAAPNNQSRALGAILDSVNARQVQPFVFDREWDDPNHPERIYFRSDHISYATKGIPVLFFTTGLHEDYHKVSDEPEKIDYEKMRRITTLLLELGTTLGNREARPR